MKRTIITFALTLACVATPAQNLWTLDSCISYAVSHANSVRRSQVALAQSRDDAVTAALDFLPTVSGQVSGQYSWGRNVDPETNTYNTITTFNNYYSVGASVSLFDGGQTLNAFRRAKNARAQAETTLQKEADDKALTVMTKFVDAIYNQKSVALAEEKLADSRALLQKTQRLFELGEKSRPDVAQMESQVAEDDYNLLHQQNQARQALMALKSEMNYPVGDTLCLSDEVPVGTWQAAGRGRLSVELEEQKVKDLKYAWLMAKGNLLPSISLGGGLQTNYYRNISQGSGTAGAFGAQMKNNLGEYVYLSLSIPLFAPSKWRTARRAKSEWQKAQLDLDDARRKLCDDRAQAEADLAGYRREVSQMERKVAADSLAYHLSSRKFEEGMLSTFDLHTASQTLLQSRIKLLQSRLMLIMKRRLVEYLDQ